MGLDLVHAAYRCDLVRGTAKAVLNFLATLARENEGNLCWPSVEQIAAGVGRSVRQVQRALSVLAAPGLVKMDRRGGKGRTSRYWVVLERVTSAARGCGQAVRAVAERVTSGSSKGDTGVTRKKERKKEEKFAPKQPVDKSAPWARGFSHLSGFFATSSCASSAPGAPCRPGGSPQPGLPPFTTQVRSTATSAGSCNATSSARSGPQVSGSVADLVAEFLAERQGTPGARPGW
jgi:hypothetical protein